MLNECLLSENFTMPMHFSLLHNMFFNQFLARFRLRETSGPRVNNSKIVVTVEMILHIKLDNILKRGYKYKPVTTTARATVRENESTIIIPE